MCTKRGGVAAYHTVWIGLCLRSVPGLRVPASAVDDCSRPLDDCSRPQHICMYTALTHT